MDKDLAAKIRDYTDNNQQRIIDLIKELVLVESPTQAPSAHSRIHDILERELSSAGFNCFRKKGRTSGGLFYGSPIERQRGLPTQLILGHCDTVWDIGSLELNMPLLQEGNHLRGPGVYDMKAGLAQTVYALKALRELKASLPLTPLVLITSDEELGSEDSVKLIRTLAQKVRRVLIPEPSYGDEGRLKTSRKGVGRYEIKITGKAAHSGLEPEKGISAVTVLANAILELNELNDYPKGISVNVGVIEGGTRENVVPSSARALIDVRVRTTADAIKIDQAIRDLQPSLPGAVIEVTGGIDRPPLERTERNRNLWRLAQESGRDLGIELGEVESGGASDGNFTSEFTATLDGLGAVGDGAHALHEFIRLDRISERTALLALLLTRE